MSSQYKTFPLIIDGGSLFDDIISTPDAVLNYETEVRSILDKITNCPKGVGQSLLNSFPKDKTIVIVPYESELRYKKYGECKISVSEAEVRGDKTIRIQYLPSSWVTGGFCKGENPNGIGAGDDEFLLRELLQTYIKTREVSFIRENKGDENVEETLAILISNIYISENGKTKFRKDHTGIAELSAKCSTSEGFMRDPYFYKCLELFWLIEKPLFSAIASSPAVFNPFKAYKRHKEIREFAMMSLW